MSRETTPKTERRYKCDLLNHGLDAVALLAGRRTKNGKINLSLVATTVGHEGQEKSKTKMRSCGRSEKEKRAFPLGFLAEVTMAFYGS